MSAARTELRDPPRYWSHLTSRDLAALDREHLIAVLPVAAIEQHGPHMPIATDTTIVDGIVAATCAKLPDDLPVLFLPTAAYGKSNEHARYPGTITLSAQTLISLWMDIGASVAAAGVRKFVLFNSHGGQVSAMDIVVRDLRERHAMLAVAASWFALGLPEGLFDEREVKHGIHAGDIETSVVLALTPEQVRLERAQDFRSLTETLAQENRFLSIGATGKMGWQTQDLNPHGACGDATRASADKGRQVLDFVAGRFVELLREIDRYDLKRLEGEPAWR